MFVTFAQQNQYLVSVLRRFRPVLPETAVTPSPPARLPRIFRFWLICREIDWNCCVETSSTGSITVKQHQTVQVFPLPNRLQFEKRGPWQWCAFLYFPSWWRLSLNSVNISITTGRLIDCPTNYISVSSALVTRELVSSLRRAESDRK